MSESKKKAPVELITRHRLSLAGDDVHTEPYEDRRRAVLTESFHAEVRVMHCSSFSKTLAPGYCIGWISPGRFMREVTHQRLTISLTTSLPAQPGIARYLERGS